MEVLVMLRFDIFRLVNCYYIRSLFLLSFILIALLFISCSLDRKNPLDPASNPTIRVPGRVTGLTYSKVTTPQNVVILRWNQLNDVDGYYIYRALSLHTAKERITTIESNLVSEYNDSANITSGRTYYYWISAFIDYPEGRIEGPLSDRIGFIF